METDKDIENVEAWARVVEDLLDRVPMDKRRAVLEATAQRLEQPKRGLKNATYDFEWAEESVRQSISYRGATMRLKGLIVQIFVRDLSSENSPEKASKLLFSHHPYGHGSRYLGDYIRPLIEMATYDQQHLTGHG